MKIISNGSIPFENLSTVSFFYWIFFLACQYLRFILSCAMKKKMLGKHIIVVQSPLPKSLWKRSFHLIPTSTHYILSHSTKCWPNSKGKQDIVLTLRILTFHLKRQDMQMKTVKWYFKALRNKRRKDQTIGFVRGWKIRKQDFQRRVYYYPI